MIRLDDKFTTLVAELNQPEAVSEGDPADGNRLPRMIGLGDGTMCVVSRAIDETIFQIADEAFGACSDIRQAFLRNDWRNLVRNSFGIAFKKYFDCGDEKNGAALIHEAVVKDICAERKKISRCDIAYGCTVYDDQGLSTISVGPVEFKGRKVWLEELLAANRLQSDDCEKILARWNGGKEAEPEPETSELGRDAQIVLNTVGKFKNVCTVRMGAFSIGVSRNRAQVAANLGLTALALLWEFPSRALARMALSVGPGAKGEYVCAHKENRLHFASFSGSAKNVGLTPIGKSLGEVVAEGDIVLREVGKFLSLWVEPQEMSQWPRTSWQLFQAMLWLHEACTELQEQISVVKYGAALDALAGESKKSGVVRLLEACFRRDADSEFLDDGRTIRGFVDLAYSEGRSRSIHGTSELWAHDWQETKKILDRVCRYVMVRCLEHIAQTNCPECLSGFSEALAKEAQKEAPKETTEGSIGDSVAVAAIPGRGKSRVRRRRSRRV